jgi:transcriptional regulator with XRE-family HTH domain
MKVAQIGPLLKARGLTQAALAHRLGVSRVHVTQMLSGKRRMSAETLQKVQAFLSMHKPVSAMNAVGETAIPFVTLEEAKFHEPSRLSKEERELIWREISELAEAAKRAPRIADLTDDEILGYDSIP